MSKISYKRHRFPAEVIQHAVWLYFRFTLSFRDVEDLLAERGLDVSYESIRYWVLKFGAEYARKIDHRRPRPNCRWHLDEVFVSINGKQVYLWRAVDDEGEVLEVLVQSRRNKASALKLMRKLLKKQGFASSTIVTDSCHLMVQHCVIWDFLSAMILVEGRTIGQKTLTYPSDDERERCRSSSRQDQHRDFSPHMPSVYTFSTRSAISFHEQHFDSFTTTRCWSGFM